MIGKESLKKNYHICVQISVLIFNPRSFRYKILQILRTNRMKGKIYFIFLFFYCIGFSQTLKSIDEDCKKISSLKDNKEEFLKQVDKILESSVKKDYSKGKVLGYYNKAYYYYKDYNLDNSIKYLKLAESEDYFKQDTQIQAKVYIFLGEVSLKSGLHDEAIDYFKMAAKASYKVSPRRKGIYLEAVAYNDMSAVFAKSNLDSLYHYSLKSYKVLKNFPDRNDSLNILLAKSAVAMGMLYKYSTIKVKNDSSSYYMKESLVFIPKNVDKESMDPQLYNQISKIYLMNGLPDEAKKYAELYTKNAEKKEDIHEIEKAYELKALVSDSLKDADKYNNLKKYVTIKDKVEALEEKNRIKVIKNIIKDNNNTINHKNKFLYSLIGLLFLIIAISILIFYRVKHTNALKKKLLFEKESTITSLESKVNIAFDEVIELAKKNSPEFITRFQEVYPEFCKKISGLQPDMRKSELIFCAYLLLGFSTKDIVTYTFVSPETVKMRRYRLRKKFNIPSDKDLNLWMKDLDESSRKSR